MESFTLQEAIIATFVMFAFVQIIALLARVHGMIWYLLVLNTVIAIIAAAVQTIMYIIMPLSWPNILRLSVLFLINFAGCVFAVYSGASLIVTTERRHREVAVGYNSN